MTDPKVIQVLHNVLQDLKNERDQVARQLGQIFDLIKATSTAGRAPGRRGPGRPPKAAAAPVAAPAKASKAAAAAAAASGRKKPHWSPEARRAAAERMRKRWADKTKKQSRAAKRG